VPPSSVVLLRSVRRLLVRASVVPSSRILVTLMKEALIPSETSVLTGATQLIILEDAILLYMSVILHNNGKHMIYTEALKQTNSVAFSPQANYID
jgi:hypothetical protein